MNSTVPHLTEALRQVSGSLNILGSEAERKQIVVNWFNHLHRTMQQAFMRVVIIPVLETLAHDYEHGCCDGRNMGAGRLASMMLRNLTDDDLYLPLI